jgi:hypothetical protein
MLSSRTLYFGRGDIHFECREGLICEARPTKKGWPSHSKYPQLKQIYLELIKLDVASDKESLYKFQCLWRLILGSYSCTSLSHEEDRLISIAGVVSAPQNSLRLQSSFGFWLAFFLGELCWYVDKETSPREPGVSRFDHLPTWSWMRLVDSKIANMEEIPKRSEPLDTLYTAKVTEYPDTTPFVQVPKLATYRSTLRMKGRCVRCHPKIMENTAKERIWTLVPVLVSSKELRGDEAPAELWPPCDLFIARLYSTGGACSFHPDFPSTLVEGEDLYCLLVKRERWTDGFTVHIWDFGLVLKLEEDGVCSVFTRVGTYLEGNSKMYIQERKHQMSHDHNDAADDELMEMLISRRLIFPGEGEEMEVTIR